VTRVVAKEPEPLSEGSVLFLLRLTLHGPRQRTISQRFGPWRAHWWEKICFDDVQWAAQASESKAFIKLTLTLAKADCYPVEWNLDVFTNNGSAMPLHCYSLELNTIHWRESWDAWRMKNQKKFYYEEEENQNKKNIEKKKKRNLPGWNSKIQKLMTSGPLILEFLLVNTLVESWDIWKVMSKTILLTLSHMQWGSSNLKT